MRKFMALCLLAGFSSGVFAAVDAEKTAQEAYLFGYPLVLMDISKDVMTAVEKPGPGSAPIGQFAKMDAFPDPSFTSVVSPNADTLYSSAWLDLEKQPYILSLPDTGNRYYLMPMLDGWTNVFASPGSRTTGNQKGDYALTGPNWKGKLPRGVKQIASPTDLVWIIGRTQTNGPSDYAAVNALKAQYKLTPLSEWGKPYVPPVVKVDPNVNPKVPPVEQVDALSAGEFYARLATLMASNPPAAADRPALARLKALGIEAGKPFELAKLPAVEQEAIEKGFASGKAALKKEAATMPSMKHINGWAMNLDIGTYGTRYLQRAVIALVGLGANLPQDAVYPMARVDSKGEALDGKNRYQIRFTKDQIPPVKGFWSLTMYNNQQFFVANPINRYAIGNRDKLKFEKDGSLILYVQEASPGPDKASNWLPAPKDGFNVIMRLYWPKPSVINGKWAPPPIVKQP